MPAQLATPDATAALAQRRTQLPASAWRTLGRTGLTVAGVGFGTYRVNRGVPAHQQALIEYLSQGLNLIDCSSNYGNGGAEELVGEVLASLGALSGAGRAERVLVSKIGYVQGQNLTLAKEREAAGRPFPEMVKYADGCWHCLHPDFLADQLDRSLARLRVSSLDVYLLHNPEYFLGHAAKTDQPLNEVRAEYYRRLGEAFTWLEEQVAAGRIGAYGLSSNTFPGDPEDPEFSSLEAVLAMAREVSEAHHLSVIQFPGNLFEGGAWLNRNQAEGRQTLLEVARAAQLGTLINRPLNAAIGDGLRRLAGPLTQPTATAARVPAWLAHLKGLEAKLPEVLVGAPAAVPVARLPGLFNLSHQLADALEAYPDWETWDHLRQQMLEPRYEAYLAYLSQQLAGLPAWEPWAKSYWAATREVLELISAHYLQGACTRAAVLSQELDEAAPELASSANLAQRALRVLLGEPSVSSVLLGARQVAYVHDALAALRAPRLPDSLPILRRCASTL